jgi:hypothetical protein
VRISVENNLGHYKISRNETKVDETSKSVERLKQTRMEWVRNIMNGKRDVLV